MSQLLAVYGTLKKGGYNNTLLTTSRYAGKASIPGELWTDMGENFPRASYIPGHDKVIQVELYEITPRIMVQLARLEIPYGYYPQVATTVDGTVCIMWANVEQRGPNSKLISDGNFTTGYDN